MKNVHTLTASYEVVIDEEDSINVLISVSKDDVGTLVLYDIEDESMRRGSHETESFSELVVSIENYCGHLLTQDQRMEISNIVVALEGLMG